MEIILGLRKSVTGEELERKLATDFIDSVDSGKVFKEKGYTAQQKMCYAEALTFLNLYLELGIGTEQQFKLAVQKVRQETGQIEE